MRHRTGWRGCKSEIDGIRRKLLKGLKIPPFKMPSPSVVRKVQRLGKKYKGMVAAIEPKTGEYFIGETLGEALEAADKKFPDGVYYFIRIGFSSFGSLRQGC